MRIITIYKKQCYYVMNLIMNLRLDIFYTIMTQNYIIALSKI